MILAKIDSNKIVVDVIIASLSDVLPEGTWVECPEWVGIGLSIDTPKPEPTVLPQPDVVGAQEF